MEMKYIVALILMLIVLLAGLFVIGKSSSTMGGLFDSLRVILGL
ncbi:MAG: hypothetical protein R6V50_01730 [Thermoplasmatota archaeon]